MQSLRLKQNIELNLTSQINMALKLHVPTINSPESAKSLKETLLTSEPDANIDVDLDAKTVTVNSQASEETFKQLIVAAGHQITNA
jgi:copper chaperone